MTPDLKLRYCVAAATAAVLMLLGLVWGLWALSTPSGSDSRVETVAASFAHAVAVRRERGDIKLYPAAALCAGADPQSLGVLKSDFERSATQADVAISEAQLTPAGEAGPIGARLSRVELVLEAKGEEPKLRAFLTGLSRGAPEIFADTLTLATDGALPVLSLKAHLLCASSLH